jgi:multiple sugar transport system permease protein
VSSVANSGAAGTVPPAAGLGDRIRDRFEGGAFPYILLAPALLTLVLVGLVPFGYTVWISLHETAFTHVEGWAGLANFKALVTTGEFWSSMGVTALILAVAIPIQFTIALGFALLLSRGVYASRVLAPALLIPAVIAPTVVAIVWKIMLAPSWGLLTYEFVERFGILSSSSIFSTKWSAVAAIILIDVWQWTPFVALALYAGIQALPLSPYRAAAVDGASRWATFRYITLPGLYPLLAVLFLIRVIDTFKIFDTVFVLTGGGPQDATQTISIYLYKNVFDFFEVGLSAAAAVIIFILFFIFASIAYRLFTRTLKLF